MTSKHFEYMFRQQDEAFFGKVASQVEKTANDQGAQLQQDLEADIQLLRSSGPVGEGFAFTKRAFAYLDMLADESNPHLEFLPTAFEKVASAAIQADVHAMLPGLSKEASKQLLEDAMELVNKAEAEKLAGGGLAFLKGLGAAGKVVAKAPVTGAVNTVRKGIRGLENARMGMASRSATKLQRGANEARAAVGTAKGPVSKAFHEGRAKSLEGSAEKAWNKHDDRLTKMVGSRAKPLVPNASGNVRAPVASTRAAEAPKAEVPKAEAPKSESLVADSKSSVGGADVAGGGKSSTMIESFQKARKNGWKSLSELEQQKLISGGLGAGLAANTLMN